jgi:hypothetical protein
MSPEKTKKQTQDKKETKLLPAVVTAKLPERYKFLDEVTLTPDQARVALSAKLLINNREVLVHTGDIAAGEFYFYLAQPAIIGSLKDACDWINKELIPDTGKKIPELTKDKLKGMGLPEFLAEMIAGLVAMKVSVEGLIIDTKKENGGDKTFHHIEVCAQAEEGKAPPLGPLTFIKINSIGFMVTKANKAYLDQKPKEESESNAK